MVSVDTAQEVTRQLERAKRLVDVDQGPQTPVRRSLEQLFAEARSRAQPGGALGVSTLASASRLLQGAQAQQLDRDVADFSLGQVIATGVPGDVPPEDQPNIAVQDFFASRHEQVITNAVEEAYRDCLRSMERHSFNKIQAEWSEAKAHIMKSIARQHLGPTTVGAAMQGEGGRGVAQTAPPRQDVAIIDAVLKEPMSQKLAESISKLSCESCPAYQGELTECWGILRKSLEPTARAVTCGAIHYLQMAFREQLKSAVYRSTGTRIGGMPDGWTLVRALGRARFESAGFPTATAHVWYAAFIAARAGFAQLLVELPDRAAPISTRCPTLRTVCSLMARRLQATTISGQAVQGLASCDVDPADLLRADLTEAGNGFHDVLVSLLLGRSFAFDRLPESTTEDWLWFRLHAIQIEANDNDSSPEFRQHLESLQQHALALPPSHYDPTTTSLGSLPVPAHGLLGSMPGVSGSGIAPGVTQTLNFVKVLLLTAQFNRAIQQLMMQDVCLRPPAVHMGIVLHRAKTLEAFAHMEKPVDLKDLISDYVCHFRCQDQLPYFRVLDLRERAEALNRLLLAGGAGTSEELLGYIDATGRHKPGLLEATLEQAGLGGSAEFTDVCAAAGRAAAERGQYREALRLLHLGRCYSEVLQVLCRCMRLHVWRDGTALQLEEITLLGQDIQRYFSIYERNLDRYALSSQGWALARRLYSARSFQALCARGQLEAALDVFDREQLFPVAMEFHAASSVDRELLSEYPRIVGDYVRILQYAATQGRVNASALRARVQRLQSFLAMHSHRLVLEQDTIAALAGLVLC